MELPGAVIYRHASALVREAVADALEGRRPLSRRGPGPKRSQRSDPSRSHRPSDRHDSAGTIGASSIKSRPGRGLLRSRLRVDEVGEIFADLYPAPFPDAIHDLVDLMYAPARREPVRPQAQPDGRRAVGRQGDLARHNRVIDRPIIRATEKCRA